MEQRSQVSKPVARRHAPRGIVIQGRGEPVRPPRIVAFIWGGKVRPVPTLPFGRWKPSGA